MGSCSACIDQRVRSEYRPARLRRRRSECQTPSAWATSGPGRDGVSVW